MGHVQVFNGSVIEIGGGVFEPDAVPPTPPNPPTQVVASLINTSKGGIQITFNPPAVTGSAPINLYTAVSSDGSLNGSSTTNTITIQGGAIGTNYTFTVQAFSSAGPSVSSAPSNVIMPIWYADPPVSNTLTAGNAQLTTTYPASANVNGSAVTQYIATFVPASGPTIVQPSTGAALSITATGAQNGVAYTCTVQAVNAFGTGAASPQSNAATPTGNVQGFDGTIKILRNSKGAGYFANGHNTPLILTGINLGGYDLGISQNGGTNPWVTSGWNSNQTTAGTQPDIPTLVNNGINFVRFQVNAAGIMKYNAWTLTSSGSINSGYFQNMDPTGTYLSGLIAFVDALAVAGIYTMIDVHCQQPDLPNVNGATVHVNPTRDVGSFFNSVNSIAASVALAQYCAGKIDGKVRGYVIIEPFNEPVQDNTNRNSGGPSYWQAWQSGVGVNGAGGSYFSFPTYWNGSRWDVTDNFVGPGYNQVIAAIRAASFTGPICCNPLEYAGNFSTTWDGSGAPNAGGFLGVLPVDPLNQLCADLHLYPRQGYNSSYTSSYATSWTSSANGGGNGNPANDVTYVINAGIPIIVGEFSGWGTNSATLTPTEPFVRGVCNLIDANNALVPGSMGAAPWYGVPSPSNANFTANQLNYAFFYFTSNTTSPVPTFGNGVEYFNWVASKKNSTPPGPVTNVTAVEVSSTSISIGYTLPTNTGGLPIQNVSIQSTIDSNHYTTNNNPAVMTSLTTGKTYTFTIVVNTTAGPSTPVTTPPVTLV